jgi:hypothetical protein
MTMGIDIHGYNLIRFAHKHKPLGRVATLGRQAMAFNHDQFRQNVHIPDSYQIPVWCESFLMDLFGASVVESFDVNDYEGCTFTQDFNKPFAYDHQTYNTIFDGGSLEHIFDIRQALQNISDLCQIGGQILHVIPANNLNGHGFYQFHTELFYSYYSNQNGYADTVCFYADYSNTSDNVFLNTDTWYLSKPVSGIDRNMFNHSFPTYILCRTVKMAEVKDKQVLASDYQSWWGVKQNVNFQGPAITPVHVQDLLK